MVQIGSQATLTDDELREWANSESVTKEIAYHLATMIRSGKLGRFASLPDRDELAREWGVSLGTIVRAKKILAEHGLIKLTRDRHYYVA
jgi:DNA-binding GntR family transcriptional regulator